MGDSIISVKDLSKEYYVGSHTVKALDSVSVDIKEGELVAIMGTSGSGKSTFLNMLGGLDSPDSGSVTVNNIVLSGKNDKELAHYRNQTVGFVFQFFYLQPYLNVAQNVEIPLMFSNIPQADRKELINKVIDAVGLSNRVDHLPSQLSGGQMQRVAIARALVNQPKVILADEPTGNLDKATGEEIMELLVNLNKDFKTTVIIVTHNQEIADKCSRTINFSDGKIL